MQNKYLVLALNLILAFAVFGWVLVHEQTPPSTPMVLVQPPLLVHCPPQQQQQPLQQQPRSEETLYIREIESERYRQQ